MKETKQERKKKRNKERKKEVKYATNREVKYATNREIKYATGTLRKIGKVCNNANPQSMKPLEVVHNLTKAVDEYLD